MSPVISLLIGAMIFIEPTFAEDITQQYTLPAQPLNKALSTVASLAKLKILFDAEQIHTLNTQSLTGTMTTAQVLEKLLQGSGYNYRFLDTHTVKLEKIPVPKSDQVTLTTLTVVAEPTESPTDHYTASNASTATKTNTPLMETPLSITVMPKAVIQDQQAVQLSDVTKNVSGVFQGTNLGGFVEQFIMRGFNTSYVNYYDGYRFPNASGMSLANAERVEVIKGTAANLYGRVEPGGMINVVTKRPQLMPYYALQQQFGSYDLYRTTADATGAVTENGSLLYCLNLEYLTKNSFRDYGYNERTFLAPSITWKISDRDQVDVDLMYSEQNSQVDYGLPLNTLTNRPANVPISRYLGEPATDNSHSNLYNTGATYTHAFSEDWKLSARFNYLNRSVDFAQTSPLPFLPFPPFPPSLNTQTGVMQRAYTRGINTIDSYFGTVDMTGRFTTGVAKHTLLAGWDNYQLTLTEQNYLYPANSINIYNPIYRPKNISQLQPNDFHDGNLQWNGAYIQDQITLFTKLHILGGGRYDWISETAGISDKSLALASARSTSVQNGRFNPRVGLLYQPWQWLSLYGNYVESLGAANINTTPNGTILQPETAEQLEAGFKTVFFEERLSSTVAFYSLTKQNMPILKPGTFFFESISKARSQGIEVDVAGKITEGLSLIANYTATDALILQGKYAGNALWNVPKNAGSVWAKYDLQQEALTGLSLGAGVYLQGQKPGDMANSYQLPGYGRVDALVKYKIAAAKTTLQFNVENLLSKQYYTSSLPNNIYSINPGTPITFMGSIKVEF